MTEAEIGVNVLQRWRKGATAKECKQPLEAEKRQGNGFPSELLDRNSPDDTLILAL